MTVPSRYTLSQTPDKATYRAYGKFAARENVNLYFSVGTGFRSGGFNNPSEVPRGAPANYGTENSIFYELGMKTLLAGGRVRFDAAAYYGEWNDMQVDIATTSPVDGGYLQYTANGQDAEIKGVEVEISLAATDGLTLNLAGDVTHTEISRVDPKNNAPGFFLGDKIDYVPKYKVSAGADYRFNWSPSMPGFFLVNVDRIGKSYVTARTFTFGNTVDVAPELAFLSARIGGERAGWKWALFGANLTDERKPLSGATTGLRPQARPRTLGVMLGKSF